MTHSALLSASTQSHGTSEEQKGTASHMQGIQRTHCLFMDDLKTYHKSSAKVTTFTNRLEDMFSDIGLDWGIQKCTTIHIKGGKLENTENQPLTSGSQIPVLGEEDHYKFLGKLQNIKQLDQASQEYLRRLAAIWTSPLTIPRKVEVTNTLSYPVLE